MEHHNVSGLVKLSKIMTQKKILFVVNSDVFFVTHRLPIAKALLLENFEVHIALPFSKETEKILGQEFFLHSISLDRKSFSLFSNFVTFIQIVKLFFHLKPDLIHLITIKPILFGGIAARLLNIGGVVIAVSGLGYIFTAKYKGSFFLKKFIVSIYRVVFGHKNVKVIFQNFNDYSIIQNITKLNKKLTTIIPGSGVDLKKFFPKELKEQIAIVMLPARLLVDKGVREFVDAAKIIKNEKIKARFVLVGAPDPGNPNSIEINELEKWHEEGTIEWWGYQKEMNKIYPHSSIVVLPSYYGEGIPKTLIEAAACGRAVITTDHPGCRDAVIPEKTAILVKPRSPKEIADAVKYLFERRSIMKEMGKAGRKLAEEKFDVKNVVDKHLQIYNELIDKTGKLKRRR